MSNSATLLITPTLTSDVYVLYENVKTTMDSSDIVVPDGGSESGKFMFTQNSLYRHRPALDRDVVALAIAALPTGCIFVP